MLSEARRSTGEDNSPMNVWGDGEGVDDDEEEEGRTSPVSVYRPYRVLNIFESEPPVIT